MERDRLLSRNSPDGQAQHIERPAAVVPNNVETMPATIDDRERTAAIAKQSAAGDIDEINAIQDGDRDHEPSLDRSSQEKIPPRTHTTKLQRSGSEVFLVLLYATLAIFSWTVLCILQSRPMTTGHYGYTTDFYTYGNAGTSFIHSLYTKNERWLQAAQVIRSIVAVLTIPLTSTICAKAAVALIQGENSRSLTLRKTIALADRGWADPVMFWRLLSGGFKKYGTMFLAGTLLLNVLGSGGVISPLQSAFVTTTIIKTPTFPDQILYLSDIVDKFGTGLPERNEVTVLTRAAMSSTKNTNPQSHLWTGEALNCSQATNKKDSKALPNSCVTGGGGATLGNFSVLPDPFLAQLPAGHNTGLIRQFLPRINSTAYRHTIDDSEYPKVCENLPGAFYVRYASTNPNLVVMTGWGSWSFEACMPANLTNSPWTPTYQRQDFSEELYLNISLNASTSNEWLLTPQEQGGLFKITVNTTAGFFELPNYMNGQKPGVLLDDFPGDHCGSDCYWQGSLTKRADNPETRFDVSEISNSSLALEMTTNRGPLATLALALFGPDSFIGQRMANPNGFLYPNVTWEQSRQIPNHGACLDQVPFMRLLRTEWDTAFPGNYLDPCLTNNVHTHDDIQQQIVNYIRAFYWNPYDGYLGVQITNAFTAAAFLANEAWLLDPSLNPDWPVHYDLGADTTVPVISFTGIVVVSVLLGVFLAALLGLALYSSFTPRWTNQLDAFAMLRLGASLADDIHLRLAQDTSKIAILDGLPGWIGDAAENDDQIGELQLGSKRKLTRRKAYAAYPIE